MHMDYSRASPSPRYRDLIAQYRTMHTEGERFLGVPAEQTFSGISLLPQAEDIKRLIRQTGAASILDYGSGKGTQYLPQRIELDGGTWDNVQDYWAVDYVRCYDPCFVPFSDLPAEKCDGVISTDVLEHCPEDDLPWILDEMFGFARRFVFLTIACHPARKRLPSGENAHCTIKSAAWWSELLQRVAALHPGIVWEAKLYEVPPGAAQAIEQRLRG
jgi:hypothetical protein